MNIVVGVTGGIAAYKAVSVIRALVLAGHDVHVVATDAALRFVGLPTLEAISRNPVHHELYDGVAQVRHVAMGQAADVIVLAPATANTIARVAAGLADDLLGTTILASTAPLVVAPAMHTEMWNNPATVHNIATLRARGAIIVGPASGQLTGSDSGPGRMSEPDDIVRAVLAAVRPRDLKGKRFVITAGGTREPIDPVRFIGNRSSGRQGVALATVASERGATVTLIGANIDIPVPDSIATIMVTSSSELADATFEAAASADVVIMAAAVADYRTEAIAESKLKKEIEGDELTLRLVKTEDILATLVSRRRRNQTIVGFAAETEPNDDRLLELGRAKIERKDCDFLVVNRVGWQEGFGGDDNSVTVLNRAGDIVMKASGTKLSVASHILDLLN
ncbi:MAG: bifunctional phosphopantothenoylcysteine decarboxylase/phosphopantothenate--cysteine ligase CoaBC [Cryobacterium sp.]|nr:bifunctional phosphopantothenoylcysteine decarboxylase/phosphopantothenate--cysteine ligase CoaBC [Cryobacterium sp.]